MRVATLLSSLLASAWLAVDLALAAHLGQSPLVWPQALAAASLGLAFGQAALACAWLLWSRRSLAARLPATAAALYLCSVIASASVDGGSHAGAWLSFLLIYAGLLGAALGGLRCAGVCVVCSEEGLAGTSGPASLSPAATLACRRGLRAGQFSLGALFSCMTAVAVPLGLSRRMELPSRSPVALLGFALCLTVAALIPLGISWRSRDVLRGALLLAALCPAVGLLFPLAAIPPKDHLALALMASVHGGSIAASVTVLRIAGYHLATRHAAIRKE